MPDLTDEQRDALLLLGSGDGQPVALSVWRELIDLDLVYRRDGGPLDLTELGETIYDQIADDSV